MDERIFIRKIKSKRGFIYTLQCLNCSMSFELHGFKFNEGKGKYCTLKCANSSSKHTQNIRDAQINIDRIGRKNPNWKGGHSLYIRFRKRYCEKCGVSKSNNKRMTLNVHHIDENRKNGSPYNLITVCDSCHKKEHATLYQRKRDNLGRFFSQ